MNALHYRQAPTPDNKNSALSLSSPIWIIQVLETRAIIESCLDHCKHPKCSLYFQACPSVHLFQIIHNRAATKIRWSYSCLKSFRGFPIPRQRWHEPVYHLRHFPIQLVNCYPAYAVHCPWQTPCSLPRQILFLLKENLLERILGAEALDRVGTTETQEGLKAQ